MRYAVVTGVTKGIGRAIAEKFLEKGFFIIGNFAKDEIAAEEFLKANQIYEKQIKVIKQELCSYETSYKFAEQIKNIASKIDILILNSGTTDRTAFGSITEEGWAHVINVNLNAPFFLIQELKDYIAENTGRVILIGSIMGKYPHGLSISYGVSKAALHELAPYLVKYFSPKGITVNVIMPGFVNTPWQAAKEADQRKRIENKTALNRFARPEEIASFCMSVIENQYINGSILQIDGGYCYE